MQDETFELGARGWNNDPEWEKYVQSLDNTIKHIALKYTTDVGIREDAEQNARIALYHTWPEQIHSYYDYLRGDISEDTWNENLDKYCRQVVRNNIITTLQSWTEGPWHLGRTMRVYNSETGKREKRRVPPRYLTLDNIPDLEDDWEGMFSVEDMNDE